MKVQYIGPFSAVEVDGVGVVERDEVVDVSAALAGRAPTDDDPGAGLLAQADNWQAPATEKRNRTVKEA